MRASLGERMPRLTAAFATVLLVACASPGERALDLALASGLSRQIVVGAPFHHLLLYRPDADNAAPPRQPVHVYIDHDGSPWLAARQVARDPTPRNPLALRLMLRDPGPALYLGRPCHYVMAPAEACHPLTWTHARYGADVVDSMVRALDNWIIARSANGDSAEIVLIGYSGGGTLATLLAARLASVVAVITLAPNLDIEAWADMHDYSPLAGSLNPADQPSLPQSILQMHLVGSNDRNTPAHLMDTYLRRNPTARREIMSGFDHACCWERVWPGLLAQSLRELRTGR